jgi:hypothetical protein
VPCNERNESRSFSGVSQPKTSWRITEPVIVPTLMDEEIEEAFLKILHVESETLVTLIEVLRPAKASGRKERPA